MAKHEIMIHENMGATKTSAPYLGSYVSKETILTEVFAKEIAELSGLPAIQAQSILTGSFDAFQELEKETLVRINFDGGYVCGIITGSFPTADAAFDPVKNALELALRLDDDVKLDLVNVTPTIVADATVTKVRVDHVMDVEFPRPYEVIHGQHTFDVTGVNLVTADAGASVTLVNALGVEFACTVVEVVSTQLIRVKSATLLEGGDYKLVVKSRGGDAEGPLQTSFRKVKYLKIVPTEPAFRGDITSIPREGEAVIGKFDPIDHLGVSMNGERLTKDAASHLVCTVKRGGTDLWSKDLSAMLAGRVSEDGSLLFFNEGEFYDAMSDGENNLANGDVVTAVFTNATGTTSAVGEVYNLP